MDSGLQEGDDRHRKTLHNAPSIRAVLLAFILLFSTSLISLSGSFGTNSNHVVGHDARTATVDFYTLEASPSIALVNDTITFYANASSDNPAATLTFTILYDYYLDPVPTPNPESPVTVNTTGSPGSVIRTFAYDHPGNLTFGGDLFFWVQLWVDDGTENVSSSVWVYVTSPQVNAPPRFTSTPFVPFVAIAGETKNIPIGIADNDSDAITVSWDFGDGTNATNVTVATPTGTYLSQTHSWNPRIPGKGNYNQTYTLNVSLSDGLHPAVNSSTPITVVVLPNGPPNILGPEVRASKLFAAPLEQIDFTIRASDPEGDPITWTFDYSDGTVEVYHSDFTAPGLLVWQNATHSFADVGNYTVNVSVSDALVPFQISDHNVTVGTTIHIVSNVPPIAPTINVQPVAPMINATAGYVNVTLSIQAYDLDGDWFNLTWDLGIFGTRTNMSVDDAAQRKEPYAFRQFLTFNDTGSYPIAVTVTDGRPGHEVRLTTLVNVTSNNLPPSVLEFNHEPYSLGDFAAANESVKFRLVITDREHDPIEMSWDFGDGSPKLYLNLTNYDAKGNITVSVNHTYVMKGYYNVTIFLTDNKLGFFNHNLTSKMPIQVSVRPPVTVMNWDLWDYTSLALFMMIPISSIAWFILLRRQRQHIEDQGMTFDEWRLKKEIDSKGLSK